MFAGLVAVADDEAFTASAAGVTLPEVRVESARRIVDLVVLLSGAVVSSRSASKLFFVKKLPSVAVVGIGL